MKQRSSKRSRRAPFVVTMTAAVAAVSTAGACGGDAFRDGTGSGGSGAGGSGGSALTGGAGGSATGGTGAGGTGGSGSCPTTMPPTGTACATGTVCSYPSGPCCPPLEARCVDGKWQGTLSSCNPPPPLPCPAEPPEHGSYCPSGDGCSSGYPAYVDCTWGTCPDGSPQVVARCEGQSWRVSAAQCVAVDGGSPCSGQEAALAEYAMANKPCAADGDCTTVSGLCAPAADYCDGSFYVNRSIDLATWNALGDALTDCYYQHGFGCAVCDGIPPPPACINGQCQGSF